MNAVLPDIHALGAELIVISPQLPIYSQKLKAASKLDFVLLHDAGNQVAEAYGLAMRLPDDLIAIYGKIGADLPKFNGDESWRLPIPGRFVIDKSGTVRAVDADPDYTTRPEPEDTLRALRAVA